MAIEKKAGNDLLSHSLNCSTIGAGGLNYRVRDGIGCGSSAVVTSRKMLGRKLSVERLRSQTRLNSNLCVLIVFFT